jgi:hypothetical protein
MRTVNAYMCKKVICAQVLNVGVRPSSMLGGHLAAMGILFDKAGTWVEERRECGGYLHTTTHCLRRCLRHLSFWE